MKSVSIINGPNLNLLGSRQTEFYGQMDFDTYLESLKTKYKKVSFLFFQSNIEGELIDRIHETSDKADGIILNAGAYTHTSIAMADAVLAVNTPVVEVHISNIYAREAFRHTSYIAPYCKGVVAGFGLLSYELALLSFMND